MLEPSGNRKKRTSSPENDRSTSNVASPSAKADSTIAVICLVWCGPACRRCCYQMAMAVMPCIRVMQNGRNWDSFGKLPHCWGAVCTRTPPVYCHIAEERWAVGLFQYTATLLWRQWAVGLL